MKHLKKTLVAGLLAACSHAWAAPTLSIITTPGSSQVGSVVDLDVTISDVADLYGYNFTVNFDASLFRAIGVSEGAFLGTAGATDFGYLGINNATGNVSYIYDFLLGPVAGASGSGSLARIQLEAIGIGRGAFSVSDLVLVDSTGADLAVIVNAGAQAEVPEPASYALFGIGLFGAAALRRRSQSMRG